MKKSMLTIGAVFLLFSSGGEGKFIGVMDSTTEPKGVQFFEVVHSTGGRAPSLDEVMRAVLQAGQKNIKMKGKRMVTSKKEKVTKVTVTEQVVERDAGLQVK